MGTPPGSIYHSDTDDKTFFNKKIMHSCVTTSLAYSTTCYYRSIMTFYNVLLLENIVAISLIILHNNSHLQKHQN